MPSPEPPDPDRSARILRILRSRRGPPPKRPRRKGGEPEREPVEPPNPRPLSGGAAAELEYDD